MDNWIMSMYSIKIKIFQFKLRKEDMYIVQYTQNSILHQTSSKEEAEEMRLA